MRSKVVWCVLAVCVFAGAKLSGQFFNDARRPLGRGSLLDGGSPTFLRDAFVDTNGTAITAHTMNVGPGWTVQAGNWIIQNNMLDGDGSGAGADAVTSDSGRSDVTASVDATPNDTTKYEEIVVRFTDTNNFWMLAIKSGSPGELSIYEQTAGVLTQRATASPNISNGTVYSLKLIANGANMTGTLTSGGTQISQISYGSATSNRTATKCGIRGSGIGPIYANFKVTSP